MSSGMHSRWRGDGGRGRERIGGTMNAVRCCISTAMLVAPLATAAAQTAADRTAIGEAALSAWEHALRSRQCAYCAAQLVFEPLVLRGRWDRGARADTTRRDSATRRKSPSLPQRCEGPRLPPSWYVRARRSGQYPAARCRRHGARRRPFPIHGSLRPRRCRC